MAAEEVHKYSPDKQSGLESICGLETGKCVLGKIDREGDPQKGLRNELEKVTVPRKASVEHGTRQTEKSYELYKKKALQRSSHS